MRKLRETYDKLMTKCMTYDNIKHTCSNYFDFSFVYTPCLEKNIPVIFDCNLKKDCQILIICDINISDTTGNQMTPIFYRTHYLFLHYLGKQNQQNIVFCPISPFRVFPSSAEADIW